MHSSNNLIPKIISNKEKPKILLNNIIVLADEKNYSREFLKCIGMSSGSPYLCTRHIPTKLFTFQIYGLEETDEKIFNHIKINAGLIIITSIVKYSKLLNIICMYCDKITHIPILIVLENCSKNLNLTYMVDKPNVKYEFLNMNFNNFNYIQGGNGLNNIEWFNSLVLKHKPIPQNILDLEELVKQFVNCELSIENWNHFNRLRLVYFSLKNFDYDKTIDQTNRWLCLCWNKYKNTIGHSHLWNYTLTKFWIDKILD